MTPFRRMTMLGVAGVVLALLPTTSVHADEVFKRHEHSTDIDCETRTEDGWTVSAGVNRNTSSEGLATYAVAELFSDDGSVDAYGQADGIVFEDGRIEAEVELFDHSDVFVGTAHMVGSYQIGEATVWRGRPLKMLGNQYMVRETTFAPVSVAWQTLEVAGVELVTNGKSVVEFSCDGYDMILNDKFTTPHRLSIPVEEYRTSQPCSPAPLTDVIVVPSEAGLSLVLFGEDGLVGDTSLDVSDTNPQLLLWWLPDAQEPVYAEITAVFTEDGTPRTEVVTERGRTIRTTAQSFHMEFRTTLPDGSAVSGTCAIDRVTIRVVVEPY
jgi:hypothetical protein